jgi:hypothetical protein
MLDDPLDQCIGDILVNQHPAAAVAALAHVEVDAEHHGVQTGVGEGGLRVFATQFKADVFQIALGGSDDLLADARRCNGWPELAG